VYTFNINAPLYITAMDEPTFPFVRGVEAQIVELRDFAARLSTYRQAHQDFSQRLRESRPPWAKAWNEELVPLLYLADGRSLEGGDRFTIMPDGHASDLELVSGGERQAIQVTVADLVWLEASFKPGHLHALKARHLAEGPVWGGARLHREDGQTVSEPHARGLEEDISACKAGLVAALERKRSHDGRGKTLLVYARDFSQHLYDVDTNAMIAAAVASAPRLSFDRLCVVDWQVFWQRGP
jgi:hypothetical protein